MPPPLQHFLCCLRLFILTAPPFSDRKAEVGLACPLAADNVHQIRIKSARKVQGIFIEEREKELESKTKKK
jgi:hypothetical protein